jgi:hypothetical protein
LSGLARWFDPDANWFSRDKWEHAVGFWAVSVVTTLVVQWWDAGVHAWWAVAFLSFLITCALGLAFEAGQLDTARNPLVGTLHDRRQLLGQPGYGIGLIDLCWDAVGGFLGATATAWLLR